MDSFMNHRFLPCLAAIGLLGAVACGSNGAAPKDSPTPPDPESFGGTDWSPDGNDVTGKPSAEGKGSVPGGGAADAGAMPGASGGAGSAGASSGSTDPGSGGSSEGYPGGSNTGATDAGLDNIPPGQLTAGEWNDLEHWSFFRDLLVCPAQEAPAWCGVETTWGFATSGRFSVRVKQAGAAVSNASVTLADGNGSEIWSTRTDIHGQAELFASMFAAQPGPYTVRATTSLGFSESTHPEPQGDNPIVLEVEAPLPPPLALDLMFVIDTTGSMGDELSYIQAEVQNVLERVDANLGQDLAVRLSSVFYRDEGDFYVVRSYPFTTEVGAAVGALQQQWADGGGDEPEAVDRALQVAIDHEEWNDQAAARLMFLILDAPPHLDRPGTMERTREMTQRASAKGIKIIPVGASGISKDTEFLLRFFGVATNGTYTFLTDHSGIGGDHLDPRPTIGAFEVELLNDLLVRLVSENLAP